MKTIANKIIASLVLLSVATSTIQISFAEWEDVDVSQYNYDYSSYSNPTTVQWEDQSPSTYNYNFGSYTNPNIDVVQTAYAAPTVQWEDQNPSTYNYNYGSYTNPNIDVVQTTYSTPTITWEDQNPSAYNYNYNSYTNPNIDVVQTTYTTPSITWEDQDPATYNYNYGSYTNPNIDVVQTTYTNPSCVYCNESPTYTNSSYYTNPTYTNPTYYTNPTTYVDQAPYYTNPTYTSPTYTSPIYSPSPIYSQPPVYVQPPIYQIPPIVTQPPVTPNPNPTPTCPAGYYGNASLGLQNCYKPCASTTVYYPNTCPTPNPQTCPSGYVLSGSQCVIYCSTGTVYYPNTCPSIPTPPTPTCPAGYYGNAVWGLSSCYKSCPTGTVYYPNDCPAPNPQPCVPCGGCPGYTNTYGCGPQPTPNPTPTCPAGYYGNATWGYTGCYKYCPTGTVYYPNDCPSVYVPPFIPPVQVAPWVDLNINKNFVPFGGQAVLTWTSAHATSCYASNGWSGSRSIYGTETRNNITGPTTYTITCYNQSGQSATDSVSVSTGSVAIKVNSVITSIPTEITDVSARCNGIGLIANNAQSTAWFEYGETSSLGRTTAQANIGSAPTAPFSNKLTGLKPHTNYYCRAVMTNANGTVKGDVVKFTTLSKKVKYVAPTPTKPIKKPMTPVKTVECVDGTFVSVSNTQTAQMLSEGSKLVSLQMEKVSGDLSPKSEATYKISYKNLTSSSLRDVLLKVTLPQDFDLVNATGGAYDKETRTISMNILSLEANATGNLSWTIRVSDTAQIGKAVVTTGYASYTVPGTEGKAPVQDEVTAYVIGSIVPSNDTATSTLHGKVVSEKTSFLPDTLIEWLALFAIILILLILGRSVYLSSKNKGATTH